MSETFFFERGDAPLLISIPHDGRGLAPGMKEKMSEAGLLLPDTDWYVRDLYAFSDQLGASVLAARYSRYVIDLNRPASDAALYDGQLSTGLCPSRTFSGEDIYSHGASVGRTEQRQRLKTYWVPYHDLLARELARIRSQFGYALLWDAHSIRSRVPSLFEGVLPQMSIGTNDGASCGLRLQAAVTEEAEKSDYSVVLNGRFKGGYITRNYGNPENNVHAVQLELTQRSYMNEETLRFDEEAAGKLGDVVQRMLNALLANAKAHLRASR